MGRWFRKKRNKFGAIKTKVGDLWFDSKLEARWYQQLKFQEDIGLIEDLKTQEEFDIDVLGVPICKYRSDFTFKDTKTEKEVIADAKGYVTEVFKLKWKLMKVLYPEYEYLILKGKPR